MDKRRRRQRLVASWPAGRRQASLLLPCCCCRSPMMTFYREPRFHSWRSCCSSNTGANLDGSSKAVFVELYSCMLDDERICVQVCFKMWTILLRNILAAATTLLVCSDYLIELCQIQNDGCCCCCYRFCCWSKVVSILEFKSLMIIASSSINLNELKLKERENPSSTSNRMYRT